MDLTYSGLLTRMLNENFLFSALLELTYRCNLNCYFCCNDRMRTGTPLSLDEYVRFFRDLRDLGTFELTFSGGEPLLYPDFFELGRVARQLGFALPVKTNGVALEEAVAERLLKEVDPFIVEISLHGARPATYERQTRVSGSFERLMANLQSLRKLGLRAQLNATLTAWNEAEWEEMISLAEAIGMRIQIDSNVTPRDDGSPEPLCISASRQASERLLRIYQECTDVAPSHPDQDASQEQGPVVFTPTRRKFCGAGSLGVAVDPWGNVYPCVHMADSSREPPRRFHQKHLEMLTGFAERSRDPGERYG